jgi:signal transduction histidine kinase
MAMRIMCGSGLRRIIPLCPRKDHMFGVAGLAPWLLPLLPGLLALALAVALTLALRALARLRRRTHVLQAQQQALQARVQADNERLEHLVAERTAELTELAQHLQTAREDERARLARDLHDELGALLTSAKLDVARLRPRLAGSAPEALERLAHLASTLDSVIALKRRITEDLHPSSLEHLGLNVALEILAREYGERSGVTVALAVQPVPLARPAELVVYRLVQEAVTNISKHAQARRVWITLAHHAAQVELTVRDDGVGFDATRPPRSAYGLVGMRFRVEAEHGSLAVQSAPGQGTCIVARLPALPPG